MIIKDRVCGYCGYIGKPTTQGMGSFFVDLLIWMVFGSITALTGLLITLLIPLSWTIYHVAKYHTTTCPKCENIEMVSMSSKKGQEIMSGARGYPKTWCDDDAVHHHVPHSCG